MAIDDLKDVNVLAGFPALNSANGQASPPTLKARCDAKERTDLIREPIGRLSTGALTQAAFEARKRNRLVATTCGCTAAVAVG